MSLEELKQKGFLETLAIVSLYLLYKNNSLLGQNTFDLHFYSVTANIKLTIIYCANLPYTCFLCKYSWNWYIFVRKGFNNK